jgi:ABC-type Fe3+ transport system permease subunit
MFLFLSLIRAYVKAILACGSMVLSFFVGAFFARRGEKSTYKGKKFVVCLSLLLQL